MAGRMVVDPAVLAEHAVQLGDLSRRLADDDGTLRSAVGHLAGRPDIPNGPALMGALAAAYAALTEASTTALGLATGTARYADLVLQADAGLLRTGDRVVVRQTRTDRGVWDAVAAIAAVLKKVTDAGALALLPATLLRFPGEVRETMIARLLEPLAEDPRAIAAEVKGLSNKGAGKIADFVAEGNKLEGLADLRRALGRERYETLLKTDEFSGARGDTWLDGLAARVGAAGRARRAEELVSTLDRAPGRLGRLFRLGRAAPLLDVVAAPLSAVDLVDQAHRWRHHKLDATIEMTGDAAGITAGGASAAMLLGATSAVLPPVALVAGGVAAAVTVYHYRHQIGGFVERNSGRILDVALSTTPLGPAAAATAYAYQNRQAIADAASRAARGVGDTASAAARGVGGVASGAARTGEEAASGAARGVGEAARGVGEAARGVGDAASGAKRELGRAWGWAKRGW